MLRPLRKFSQRLVMQAVEFHVQLSSCHVWREFARHGAFREHCVGAGADKLEESLAPLVAGEAGEIAESVAHA
jgi:hypothetical protein